MNNPVIKSLILDMDGVLWRGMQPIGDLPAIFDEISKRSLNFVLATNNATTTIQQYVEKLNHLGVLVEPHQIVTSAIAAGAYLKGKYPEGGPVFVLGEAGLRESLEEQGFYISENDAYAVVVSMDRNLTFDKLIKATQLIQAGSDFIATNPDRTFPTPEGLIPGAGAILAAVEAASGSQAVVMGKPQPEMYRIALKSLNADPKNTLVVGDRFETDIVGGQALGCWTALVLSGVTDKESAQAKNPAPDMIAEDLRTLLERI